MKEDESIDKLFYYRGTTRGWAGNDCLQAQNITCTTTDPIVAILFAIKARNHGAAVILFAHLDDYEHLHADKNPGHEIECAINLRVSPQEFARKAILSIDVDQSVEVLERMGFSPLPVRLAMPASLRASLEDTHLDGQRLSLEQLQAYNRMIRGDK